MKIINRKFNREYKEIEALEVGIVLTGAEVKSIRAGRIKLDDSFVRIMDDGSAYLINAEIPIYEFARNQNYEPKKTRKLLMHKKELLRLRTKMTSAGLTLAPKSCYNKGPLIKLEIALVKGRKDIEKRKLEKERDIKINEKREAKEFMKF
jgi:SsrA-binding protein